MELDWIDTNKPYSKAFDDIYYADEDGLQESRYVFLEQNSLAKRFRELKAPHFVIGELGFGTGLNFLAAWDLWRTHHGARSQKFLHFISCEKFPLSPDQIRQSVGRWPELGPLLRTFLEKYSELPLGFHRLRFEEDRAVLTLLIGDAEQNLPLLTASVDAWFFDGFAPRKNPEMWSEKIFSQVSRLSSPTATFATYTSAGHVKRNLEGAGFQVRKFAGFGRKRDMLCGVFQKSAPAQAFPAPKEISIVGAGYAGATLADALQKRGVSVVVYEKESQIASRSSSTQNAITLPVFSSERTTLSRFGLAGFCFSRGKVEEPKPGVLFFPNKSESHLMKSLATHEAPSSLARLVSPEEASTIAGIPIREPALWIPEARCVDLRSQSKALLKNDLVQIRTQTPLTHLQPNTILANGFAVREFAGCEWLPLRAVRGQIAFLKPDDELWKLKVILTGDCSLTPRLANGLHALGATYNNSDLDLEPRAEDDRELLSRLSKTIPTENLQIHSHWVELRTSVPGQEPLIGEICDRSGQILAGNYIASAFGSRGSIYAPWAAEYLASKICGEPLPIESDLEEALSPKRFVQSLT